jgi:hypothetical protein
MDKGKCRLFSLPNVVLAADIRPAHRFCSYLLKREIERKAVTKAPLFGEDYG